MTLSSSHPQTPLLKELVRQIKALDPSRYDRHTMKKIIDMADQLSQAQKSILPKTLVRRTRSGEAVTWTLGDADNGGGTRAYAYFVGDDRQTPWETHDEMLEWIAANQ